MKNQIFTKRKVSQSITQFAIITLIVIAIGGYFGYQNYTEYQSARTALDQENQKLVELKGAADTAKTTYLALKKDMDAQNEGVNQSIEKILPSTEDFTDLARALDKYFLNTGSTVDPMFLSNLSFSPPDTLGSEFAVLPFAMSVTGDEKGLIAFLEYIENSGDLNDKSRLLDFSNMSISYTSGDQNVNSSESTDTVESTLNPVKKVNASLNLRAYFQKPIDVITNIAQ